MLSTLKNFNKYRKWINVALSTYDHFVEQCEKEFGTNKIVKDAEVISK